MTQVLLVEDSKFFGTVVKNKIEAELQFQVVWVKTYTDAVDLIINEKYDFLAALLDINLPDAPNGGAAG